jgi:hypothetical protein
LRRLRGTKSLRGACLCCNVDSELRGQRRGRSGSSEGSKELFEMVASWTHDDQGYGSWYEKWSTVKTCRLQRSKVNALSAITSVT